MNKVFTGFMNGITYPYAIIDTGNVITGHSEGMAFLDTLVTSAVLTTENKTSLGHQYIGQNAEVIVPNAWLGVSEKPTTTIAILNTFGLVVYPNGKGGSVYYFVSNGRNPLFYQASDTRVAHWSPDGGDAITIDVNPNADNNTQTVDCAVTKYQDGMVRVVSSFKEYTTSPAYKLVFQVDAGGKILFFVDRIGVNPVVDRLSTAGQLNYIGELEPNKIYCLLASVVTATGVVYKPSGSVAPNCSVMAFNRNSGAVVGKTKSGVDGSYTLQTIARQDDDIFMVCLDDDGVAPDFNAQIVDRIKV